MHRDYSTMENKFCQETQLTAITRTRNREGYKSKTTLHALGTGRWKKVREDARLIFTTQTRGIQTFSFLFPQNNPPPTCACYTATTERQFQNIDNICKERLYITHSFIFNWRRGLINFNLFLMTRTQSFSILVLIANP